MQVNLEDSDPIDARRTGTYICRFYICNPNYEDTIPHQHCRVWPELRDRAADKYPGKSHFVYPFKTPKYQVRFDNVTWIQEAINLSEHSLRGLFNFSVRLSARSGLQQHVKNDI